MALLVFLSLSHFSEGALKLRQGKSLGEKNGGAKLCEEDQAHVID